MNYLKFNLTSIVLLPADFHCFLMDDEYVRDGSDGSSPRSLTDFCSTPFTGENQKSFNHSELNQ